MELGQLRTYYLYSGASRDELTTRNEHLCTSFQDDQSEESEYLFEQEQMGTVRLTTDPVSGGISAYTADDPPQRSIGPDYPRLALSIDINQQIRFQCDPDDYASIEYIVDEAVDLIADIYHRLDEKPEVVYSVTDRYTSKIERELFDRPVTDETLTEQTLSYVPWLVILPPSYVESFGRARLLDPPAWDVRELDDDSILVTAYADLIHDRDIDTTDINHALDLPDPFEESPRGGSTT
jgi:hypothetical protein